jgi:NADH:ubiquinone oxidoreductase subunit 6 (subunit J)
METIIFYILCGLILVSAFFILFTKNVMYAAFMLLLTFTGIAGVYIFLMADIVAITQVMVYVGGILILLIFGVMFTNKLQGGKILTSHQYPFVGGLLGISIFSVLILAILKTNFEELTWIRNSKQFAGKSTVEQVGVQLMTDNVLALEVVGILLLLALIGTGLIAGKKL